MVSERAAATYPVARTSIRDQEAVEGARTAPVRAQVSACAAPSSSSPNRMTASVVAPSAVSPTTSLALSTCPNWKQPPPSVRLPGAMVYSETGPTLSAQVTVPVQAIPSVKP